jgi:HEAT repeat protein
LKNNGFETLLSNTPAKKAIDSLNSKESRELLQKSYETLSECYNIGCGQGPDRDGFYDPSLTVATITLKRILDVTASNFEKSAANLWITEEKLLEFLESENSELRRTSLANLFKLKGEEAFAIVIEKVRDLEGYAAGEIVEDLVSYLDEEKKQSFFDTIELLFKEKDSFTILETLERIETIKVSLSKLQQLSERLCRFVSIPTEGMNVKAMNHYLAKWAENNGISFNLNSHCL